MLEVSKEKQNDILNKVLEMPVSEWRILGVNLDSGIIANVSEKWRVNLVKVNGELRIRLIVSPGDGDDIEFEASRVFLLYESVVEYFTEQDLIKEQNKLDAFCKAIGL